MIVLLNSTTLFEIVKVILEYMEPNYTEILIMNTPKFKIYARKSSTEDFMLSVESHLDSKWDQMLNKRSLKIALA